MQLARPKVIIDNRERNTELISAIEASEIDIEFKNAHVGDYVISDRVCIERKTVSDFESSIINGRLFDQLKRLRENYAFPILVLEGDQDYFRLNSNVINGTIASIYIEHGVEIICTYSPKNTAQVIANLARHEQQHDPRAPSLKGGARAYTSEQFQEFVIGNLPGVGPKLAKALLKHFKSIREIANADKEKLMEVDKIGKKKAEMIHLTLNQIYLAKE
jgi:ERCC4-type nuclease